MLYCTVLCSLNVRFGHRLSYCTVQYSIPLEKENGNGKTGTGNQSKIVNSVRQFHAPLNFSTTNQQPHTIEASGNKYNTVVMRSLCKSSRISNFIRISSMRVCRNFPFPSGPFHVATGLRSLLYARVASRRYPSQLITTLQLASLFSQNDAYHLRFDLSFPFLKR